MAASICPDKAVGELCSSGGTESKKAVHPPQQDTREKTDSCYRSLGVRLLNSTHFFFLKDISGCNSTRPRTAFLLSRE